MDTARKIMIGIFANPRRTDGAFAKTDGLPFEMSYEVPSGVSANIFSYSFRRTEQYTLFMMYCSSDNIKTLDGKEGILNIGVSISRGFTLPGGKSVYDLLMAVFDKLKKNYMSESKDAYGREMFSFNRTMEQLPQSYFDDVLADYPVMESRSGHTPMKGSSSAGIELSEERIRALFGNADYYINRHFLGYSEVIVAPKLNNYFSGVRIPMPKRTVTLVPADNSSKIIAYYYENNDKRYLSDAAGSSEVIVEEQDFDRNITVTSNRNESCYELGQVSFTVNNVLSRIGRDVQLEGVVYVPAGEKIVCTIKDKPNTKIFAIDLQTPESLESIRRSIRLTLDGRDLAVDSDGRFVLKGMQIESAGRIQATCDNSRYEIGSTQLLPEDSLRVSLKYKTSNLGRSTSSVSMAQDNGKLTKLKLKIIGFSNKKNKAVTVTASCGEQFVGKKFSGLPKNGNIDFPLPDFFGTDENITISVSNDSVTWKRTYKRAMLNGSSVEINAEDDEFVVGRRSKGDKILRKIIFWSAPILLILLLATGVFAFLRLRDNNSRKGAHVQEYERLIEENQRLKKEIENLTEENYRLNSRGASHRSSDESEGTRTVVTRNRESELSEFFTKAKECLDKDELAFSDVDNLYDRYTALECTKTERRDYQDEISQLEAYHNVVSALTRLDSLAIKALDENNTDVQKLTPYHRRMVLGIYYGDYQNEDKPALYAEWSMRNAEDPKHPKWGRGGGLRAYIRDRDEKYKSFSSLNPFLFNRNKQQPEL